MPQSLATLLKSIDTGDLPPVILIGGNNEYLVDHAWHQIRDRILEKHPGIQVESWGDAADLSQVVDSYRTHSLFGGARLLLLPEVNAFVTSKEVNRLLDKATDDWSSAKTERKRSSALAKLLHVMGLAGTDLSQSDDTIAGGLGMRGASEPLQQMLAVARESGRTVSRGEGDAAILTGAISAGGAPGATLLMRAGELPSDSATLGLIEQKGVLLIEDLTREQFPRALEQALRELSEESGAEFTAAGVAALRERLGIERILADKRGAMPDLRLVISEATRLASAVGRGGKVTPQTVEEQVSSISGGFRYEFASLVSEGKIPEAVEKLRDLVAQARREDARMPLEMQYGRFIFPLADEVRQILAVGSFARIRGIDLRRRPTYQQFKSGLADELNSWLRQNGLVRQKMHPFPLYRKLEAAGRYPEPLLLDTLSRLADLEFSRKSGGTAAELGLETLVLGLASPKGRR